MGREGLSRDRIDAGQGPDMDRLPPLSLPRFCAVTQNGDQPSRAEKDPAESVLFHTAGQSNDLALNPLYRVMDERFSVYWQNEY